MARLHCPLCGWSLRKEAVMGEPEIPLPLIPSGLRLLKYLDLSGEILDAGRHVSLEQPSHVHESPPPIARSITFRG